MQEGLAAVRQRAVCVGLPKGKQTQGGLWTTAVAAAGETPSLTQEKCEKCESVLEMSKQTA